MRCALVLTTLLGAASSQRPDQATLESYHTSEYDGKFSFSFFSSFFLSVLIKINIWSFVEIKNNLSICFLISSMISSSLLIASYKQAPTGISLSSKKLSALELPTTFSWKDVGGESYVSKILNQHIPQYCGSCWAHGTLSALADRIKIARAANGELNGTEINLSIQHMLNCGKDLGGTCKGGHPR